MSAPTSTIRVTFTEVAFPSKKDTVDLPATLTLSQLRAKLYAGVADTSRYTLLVADGCVPSGAVTLADLAMGESALDVLVRDEVYLGGVCDCCINPYVEKKEQEATDNMSHIAGQLVSN